MLILIVEDDPVQAQHMEAAIRRELGAEVWRMATEYDFQAGFEEIATRKPDLIVIDVMLRWADPAEEIPDKPANWAQTGGYTRAGLRCHAMLRKDERTGEIPALLYTVLGQEALGLLQGVEYLQKGNGLDRLLVGIKQLLSLAPAEPGVPPAP